VKAEDLVYDHGFEAIEGAIMSDAHLSSQNPSWFQIAQGGTAHLDWLFFLYDCLTSIGLNTKPPRIARTVHDGGPYIYSMLASRRDPFFSSLREKWYPQGSKRIPNDFILTPVSLANWFMGDGGSFWNHDKIGANVSAYFECGNFPEDNIRLLEDQLKELGCTSLSRHQRPRNLYRQHSASAIRVTVRERSIGYFMSMVEPYILPSFRYKVKFPGKPESATEAEISRAKTAGTYLQMESE